MVYTQITTSDDVAQIIHNRPRVIIFHTWISLHWVLSWSSLHSAVGLSRSTATCRVFYTQKINIVTWNKLVNKGKPSILLSLEEPVIPSLPPGVCWRVQPAESFLCPSECDRCWVRSTDLSAWLCAHCRSAGTLEHWPYWCQYQSVVPLCQTLICKYYWVIKIILGQSL